MITKTSFKPVFTMYDLTESERNQIIGFFKVALQNYILQKNSNYLELQSFELFKPIVMEKVSKHSHEVAVQNF